VRSAALKAAATAAARATLESPGAGREVYVGTRAQSQSNPNTNTEQHHDNAGNFGQQIARLQPGGNANAATMHSQIDEDGQPLRRQANEQRIEQSKPEAALPRRDVHQAISSNMIGGHGESVEAADQAEAPDEEKLLYIGVFSQTEDFQKRIDARRAWISKLREQFGDSGQVLVEFIIGRQPHAADGDDSERDILLEKERRDHADLFHIPYEELPVKALMFFAHAVEMRYRFALKIDIDRELLYQPLIRSLQREHLGTLLYAGENLHDASLVDVADRRVQKYFSGHCYLTSWSLAQRISKAHLDHSIMLWSYNTDGADVDDMDMGKWVSWEDKMSQQLAEEKREKLEKVGGSGDVVAERVEYRLMDICRPLPPPDIRFSD